MIFSGTFLWLRQTQALTKKILLVTLARQWLSTLICSLVIPIVVLALALGLPGLSSPSSKYGVGSPSPAQTLSESIPNGAKLFFIQSPNAGDDVSRAIRDITAPLGNRARVELLQNERQLMEKCPTDMNGRTDCFAAVVFNDSPLSNTGDRQWNYTIRVSSSKSRSTFDVTQPSKATGNMFTPLQLAVDQAITNSTIVPDTYMFTRISQDQAKAIKRRASIDMILGGLGIVCFASMLSLVFHIVGMISSERESGMSQLIDVMGGGAASARVLSYVIAFDIIYFPTWVILGGSMFSPSPLSSLVVFRLLMHLPSLLKSPSPDLECWHPDSLASPYRMGSNQRLRLRRHVRRPILRHLRRCCFGRHGHVCHAPRQSSRANLRAGGYPLFCRLSQLQLHLRLKLLGPIREGWYCSKHLRHPPHARPRGASGKYRNALVLLVPDYCCVPSGRYPDRNIRSWN